MADEELAQRLSERSDAQDSLLAVVRDASGEVREVRRAGIKAIAQRLAAEDDLEGVPDDELHGMARDQGVKLPKGAGPGRVRRSLAARRGGLAVGEVAFEGEPDEIKGPGPEWERDDGGRYVNR